MTPEGELKVPVESTALKNAKTTIAAISAPTDGRTSMRRHSGVCRIRSSSLAAGGDTGAVVAM